MEQAIIFIRTRVDASHLENYLNRLSELEGGGKKSMLEKKYSCLVLHGGKGADGRLDNLDAFRNGQVKFLIATDVAARGIDIKELPYVINFTLPDKPEDYIHRVGRVGRAGNIGLAISLVAACEEKVWYHTCKTKGENCSNTKLVAKGGCCIWYEEPKLIQAIEDRLGGEPVHKLDGDFKFAGAGVMTHQQAEEQERAKLADHSKEIRPLVESLRDYERRLQIGYWEIKERPQTK